MKYRVLPTSSAVAVLAGLGCSLVVIAGCGPGASNTKKGCREAMIVGDLAITEIMANPDSTDTGKEWFEIYNNSGRSLDLTGLRLMVSRADGTGEKIHTVAGLSSDASSYLTLGAFVEPTPAWLDYSFGTGLGSLRNSDGKIALMCSDTVVDEVSYASSSDGKSLILSGALAPDYAANDDPANWCNSELEYEPGSAGSPGAANEACAGGPNPTECLDGGSARAIEVPLAGDLVITELMPDPKAANDAVGEWFEVYVNRAVDLNGLEIGEVVGTPKVTLSDPNCLRASQGSYLVFARNADTAQNGGLPAVSGSYSFGMTNGGESVFIGYGGAVLDTVSWNGSSAGVSIALDPGARDPTANDDLGSWCAGTGTYGAGDTGTPGAANLACPLNPPPGSCVEGGASIRSINPPAVGDLQITELMPNPAAVADTAGEWFELKVNRDVDLNDLELGTDPATGTVKQTISDGACLSATAGSYLLFARNTDSASNGGLPSVDQVVNFSMLNSNGGLFVGYGGSILDSLSYVSSSSGAASSVDASTGVWCDAQSPYGAGDLGTPAAANPSCP